ncbi:hypothetical protein M947_06265 [Sulfurimonas hongkongensis]|uniref:Uncharacterized protein n=1 Tax=Sulfurimonas hongkongensis TaxID=1172190 RepID=T0KRD9_9BACT|nr:hypothetical protein [Sulfurimonas hongkongensis]EQB39594.1 hypothetical protein M947_06265 [Sulfurimonas hongkongensis]
MPSSSIKPTNHRVYPCPNDKKLLLLNQIISQNIDSKIIIVSSQDISSIKESLVDITSVEVLSDDELLKDESLKCDLLISLDLPQKAILYIQRLSHTTSKALLLLNESEQKLLYPIETLLGRVIKQEIVEGFEYEKKETKPKQKQMSKQDIKDVAKKRYDESTRDQNEPKKEFKKPKRDDGKAKEWEKKKKAPNKFLGKDEKGKAIFSGKSGERNHRHDGSPKESYDAPKKVGKKINIKSLKKPKDKKAD